jgi:hypothetical protein
VTKKALKNSKRRNGKGTRDEGLKKGGGDEKKRLKIDKEQEPFYSQKDKQQKSRLKGRFS